MKVNLSSGEATFGITHDGGRSKKKQIRKDRLKKEEETRTKRVKLAQEVVAAIARGEDATPLLTQLQSDIDKVYLDEDKANQLNVAAEALQTVRKGHNPTEFLRIIEKTCHTPRKTALRLTLADGTEMRVETVCSIHDNFSKKDGKHISYQKLINADNLQARQIALQKILNLDTLPTPEEVYSYVGDTWNRYFLENCEEDIRNETLTEGKILAVFSKFMNKTATLDDLFAQESKWQKQAEELRIEGKKYYRISKADRKVLFEKVCPEFTSEHRRQRQKTKYLRLLKEEGTTPEEVLATKQAAK